MGRLKQTERSSIGYMLELKSHSHGPGERHPDRYHVLRARQSRLIQHHTFEGTGTSAAGMPGTILFVARIRSNAPCELYRRHAIPSD